MREEEETVTKKKKKDKEKSSENPPLKLCFRPKTFVGRSTIFPSRPLNYVHYVTRKFYVPDNLKETVDKLECGRDEGPKEKYPDGGVLESHVYGWYSDKQFCSPDAPKNPKFYFPRRTNSLFKLSDR